MGNLGTVIAPMNAKPPRPNRSAGTGLVQHPLFPAITVLWVASLLIFAAMAMPASLIERAAATVHLDELIPAARPPLGFTARLLLAFALALGGGAAGWLGALALRRRAELRVPVVTPTAAAPEPAPVAEPAPAPLVDDEEDFARLAAARAAPGQRRRALTSETAEAPSILEISAIPALQPLTAEPLDQSLAAPTPAPTPTPTAPASGSAEAPVRFRNLAQLGGEAAARLCLAPLESLSVVQLVERFALALQARRQRGECLTEAGPEAVPGPLAAPAAPRFETAPFAEPRPLSDLPLPLSAGRPFDMPEPEGRPLDPTAELARWTLPEPEGEGEDVAEDLLPDPAAMPAYSSLTEMRAATRVPAPLADFVRVDDGDDAPLAQIGPQPVVVFPGQAQPAPPLAVRLPGADGPANPGETEAALREALAALQKMSGAA